MTAPPPGPGRRTRRVGFAIRRGGSPPRSRSSWAWPSSRSCCCGSFPVTRRAPCSACTPARSRSRQLRRQLGLDEPIYQQLWSFLVALAHGNTGTSHLLQGAGQLADRAAVPVTASLVARLGGLLRPDHRAAGGPGRRPPGPVRRSRRAGVLPRRAGHAVVLLRHHPDHRVRGRPALVQRGRLRATTPADHLRSLVLPGLTAAIAITPVLIRSLRVGHARGAGVRLRGRGPGQGAARSAGAAGCTWPATRLIPTLTLLGINIAYLVGSTVVIEQGLRPQRAGQSDAGRDRRRDFPVVQGVTIVLRHRGRRRQPADRLDDRPARSQGQAPVTATAAGYGSGAPLSDADQAPISSRPSFGARAVRSPPFMAGASLHRDPAAAAVARAVICRYSPATRTCWPRCRARAAAHWLGTDELGRDTLSPAAEGGRTDLRVGVLACIPVRLGIVLGTLSRLLRRLGGHPRHAGRRRADRVPVLRAGDRAGVRRRARARTASTSRSRSPTGWCTRGSYAQRHPRRPAARTGSPPPAKAGCPPARVLVRHVLPQHPHPGHRVC